MSKPLIGVVTVIYLGIATDQLMRGNLPMATVYLGYSIGNLGLLFL